MTDEQKQIDEMTNTLNGIKSNNDIEQCLDCPYFGNYTDCTDRLFEDIGGYIKRLKASNKRLKTKKDKEAMENMKHV